MRRRHPDSVRWTEDYYGDMLRQLSLMGVQLQPGETLYDFARRVDGRIPIEQGNHPMERVADWICGWRFGEIEPPQENLGALCRYHTALEQRLRIMLGAWEYFWKRCVNGFFTRR